MRFYRDWYRPNLMAVIVVGDVDRDAVVGMIKQHFSSLTKPSPERPRPAFDVPEHAGHALRGRDRQGNDRDRRRAQRPAAGAQPGRRSAAIATIMLDQLFADMLGARLDELSQSENPPFLRAAADRALFPTPRTKDEASPPGARLERRRGARPRRARDRTPARRRVRLHRDRARPREAGDDGRLRARGHGKPGPRVGEPRRRVHAQLPPGRSAADDLAGARVPPALRSRHHAGARSTRSPTTGSPSRTGSSSSPAPEAAGVVLPDQAQLAAVVRTAPTKRLERVRRRAARGRRSWTRRRRAARS